MPSQSEISAVRANLAFTCVHEADHLPPLDPEADKLFKYGLFLEKLDGHKDLNAAARYYRIASAYGHYKANHNLQLLVSQGRADSPHPDRETIDLVEKLIKAGVPGGYYDMGHYLELGYGVEQNADKARRYFRKAADLGSPEAQAYVANLLAPIDKAPDIARQMRQCAVDQGQRDAANTLGIDLQTDKLFPEAVKVFQKGVAAGDTLSALALEEGFKAPPATNELNYLALASDPERSRRYKLIGKFIDEREGHNPKVPDIDKIVPLPPAKLPPWDGTFQWQKEQDAAVPPQKPSEELVHRLAKSKNLDPATGLPLSSGEAKTSQVDEPAEPRARTPIGTTAKAGARCPESGVWCAQIRPELQANTTRTFSKGDVLPLLDVYEPRPLALLDSVFGKRRYTTDVIWKLVAYEKA
ncbi:sel1 repeat family protein [Burkholderia reimsis]|uniref:Sel1 repeat family protein n=1 Tax=Burkholderia reimsis TaxID=2234132 RepID=A0A365QKI8_9BURK|nr:sel1 repeat family protein [Burkholderia reimsis]